MLPLITTRTRSYDEDAVMIEVEMVRRSRHPSEQAVAKERFEVDGRLIGRWEDDTLVVETTNFHRSAAFEALRKI
jgi:hypothetical protein